MSVFTIHKSLPLNQWIADDPEKKRDRIEEAFENSENSKFDYILDPNDYEAFINPRLVGETVAHEYQWEYWPSFP